MSSPAFGITVLRSVLSSRVRRRCPAFGVVVLCSAASSRVQRRCPLPLLFLVSCPRPAVMPRPWYFFFVVVPIPTVAPTVLYPCRSSSPPFAVSVPLVRCPRRLPSSSCRLTSPRSTVVSTSMSPHEQWLAGGVVVLCDVAPVATLRAEARSSGVG